MDLEHCTNCEGSHLAPLDEDCPFPARRLPTARRVTRQTRRTPSLSPLPHPREDEVDARDFQQQMPKTERLTGRRCSDGPPFLSQQRTQSPGAIPVEASLSTSHFLFVFDVTSNFYYFINFYSSFQRSCYPREEKEGCSIPGQIL